MKRWKIIRIVTIMILILFVLYLAFDAIACIRMSYPHMALGLYVNIWIEQFGVDLIFIFIQFGIPIIIDIVLLIVSIIKIKKYKRR